MNQPLVLSTPWGVVSHRPVAQKSVKGELAKATCHGVIL